MIKIVGTVFLIIFILFALWILMKTTIEVNYNINKKLQKAGHKGNYRQYKKFLQQKKKRKNMKN